MHVVQQPSMLHFAVQELKSMEEVENPIGVKLNTSDAKQETQGT